MQSAVSLQETLINNNEILLSHRTSFTSSNQGIKDSTSTSAKRSQSFSAKSSYKSRITECIRVVDDYVEDSLKEKSFYFECEGIPIQNRGKSKGIYYFDCSSCRLKNAP